MSAEYNEILQNLTGRDAGFYSLLEWTERSEN
jgi:hypothetical protein